jgi:hypothetical protein
MTNGCDGMVVLKALRGAENAARPMLGKNAWSGICDFQGPKHEPRAFPLCLRVREARCKR